MRWKLGVAERAIAMFQVDDILSSSFPTFGGSYVSRSTFMYDVTLEYTSHTAASLSHVRLVMH